MRLPRGMGISRYPFSMVRAWGASGQSHWNRYRDAVRLGWDCAHRVDAEPHVGEGERTIVALPFFAAGK